MMRAQTIRKRDKDDLSDIWSDGVLKRRKPLNKLSFELAPTKMQL